MKPELLVSLKSYSKKKLLNDLFAGLMVAIIALPLSIALGIQSGATLQNGILTAIFAGFCISAFGGSRYQIGGPTAAFVVILFGYLQPDGIGMAGLQLATILAGVLLLIMGFCRLGKAVGYLPYPIVIGFTTGIGITLFVGQLKDFLSLDVEAESEFLPKLIGYAKGIPTANLFAILVGALALAIIYLLPRLTKKIPAAFASVVVATGVVALLKLAGIEVATIGSTYGAIRAEFPVISPAALMDVPFAKVIAPALVIAFLCALESLLSATVADGMTKTEHNSNQELVGQGVGNIASACFGGLPATGAIARTAASISNGAQSPLAGVFHALFLLAMYLVLMPVMKFIPLCALAAILISVALHMSNFPLFAKLCKAPVIDIVILAVTCGLTVFFDLTYGVIGGFVVALVCNIPALRTKPRIGEVQDGTLAPCGKLCFLQAVKLTATLKNAKDAPLTLDLQNVQSMDITVSQKLMQYCKNSGADITIVNANQAVQSVLVRAKAMV